jgi:hypothetical protein
MIFAVKMFNALLEELLHPYEEEYEVVSIIRQQHTEKQNINTTSNDAASSQHTHIRQQSIRFTISDLKELRISLETYRFPYV